MKRSDETVSMNVQIACTAEALWQALVDPVHMRQWYFTEIPDFKAEQGFRTEFLVQTDERDFLHQWQVTEVEPGRRIAYRWRYEGYPGAALSVFEISTAGNYSVLQLSFPVEEDFPDEIPEFQRDACLGGWQYLTGQLKSYLES